MEMLDRITVDPARCLGQPSIRNTRITVSVVLRMLASHHSVDDVLDAYPELEPEDIWQAMSYAAWVVPDRLRMLPAA